MRAAWGSLTQKKVTALTALLDFIEADEEMTDVRHIAYVLATIKHEAAHTFEPIAEYGKGKGKPYGRKDPETGQVYFGRGFSQITHRINYKKLGDAIGVDLVYQPDLALDPEIAYQILSVGMRKGMFTGKALGNYISGSKCDYLNARKIINAMDKAQLIAGYAKQFQTILESARDEEPAAPIKNGTVEEAPKATSTEIVKTTTVEQTAAGTETKETTLVEKIAANESVKSIASEGVTKLATRATTALTTGSTASATGGAATGKTWLIILSIVLAVGAIGVVLFLLWHKHSKEKQAAMINSDKDRADIKFVKP